MAKIRNTMAPNMYGEGNVKEVTLDNGEKYIIRNTMAPNMYGDGNEQEIIKADDYYNSSNGDSLWIDLILLIVSLIGIGILWILFENTATIMDFFF